MRECGSGAGRALGIAIPRGQGSRAANPETCRSCARPRLPLQPAAAFAGRLQPCLERLANAWLPPLACLQGPRRD